MAESSSSAPAILHQPEWVRDPIRKRALHEPFKLACWHPHGGRAMRSVLQRPGQVPAHIVSISHLALVGMARDQRLAIEPDTCKLCGVTLISPAAGYCNRLCRSSIALPSRPDRRGCRFALAAPPPPKAVVVAGRENGDEG